MPEVDDVKAGLRRKTKKGGAPTRSEDLLSTGSTLLNIGLSGSVDGGFVAGHYFLLVGDSTSGKTWLSLSCLAEAAINPRFDDYRFVYDSSEFGALMDIEGFFGKAVAERLESPGVGGDGPQCSHTVEAFYYALDDLLSEGRPFIYILDSMDVLSSEAEEEKFAEWKEAHRKGKESAGDYGASKAKINSMHLRKVMGPLKESKSILIVISQTRDNLSFGFGKKSRSGGHALQFYSTAEIWSSVRRRIQRTHRGKKRQLGIICQCQIKKNRLTGRERVVEFPILHSHGIDDVGSMVSYLVDEGVWKLSGNKMVATGLGPMYKGTMEQVVRWIEERGMVDDLRALVGITWNDVEKACRVERKKRYE